MTTDNKLAKKEYVLLKSGKYFKITNGTFTKPTEEYLVVSKDTPLPVIQNFWTFPQYQQFITNGLRKEISDESGS